MSKENTNLARVRRILGKLEQAQVRQLSCYGSDSHDFRLNPPLSESDLQAFEIKHQIRLPEDYRAFLLHAGNGGAGPYNGLFPLDEWNDFADWVEDDRPDNFLALPCPLYIGMPQTPDWEEHFSNVSPYQGTLSLNSRGCAYATQLIVSGPCAGRVVYVDADGNEPPYIVHEPDFLSWYERWLDELLQGYEGAWFGYGPGGGEEDFLQILDDLLANDEFKTEAARAFCRLPRLSDNAAQRMPSFLNSSLAGVRLGALATIAKFELKAFSENAAQLLADPSADVRQRAIYTVSNLDPLRWIEAIRRRLQEDSDDNVVRAAFFQLQRAGALTQNELLHLVNVSPRHKLRGVAATEIGRVTQDVPLLIRLLTDEDDQVRLNALLGLRRLQSRTALPQILEMLSRERVSHIIDRTLEMLAELREPSTAPILLEWANSTDDFHRLNSIKALAQIGDERATPIAQAMLQEERQAFRKTSPGGSMSTTDTISELVRKSLQESPNFTLRQLAL